MSAVNGLLMSCQLCNVDAAEQPEKDIGGFAMTNLSVAVLSAAEFEIARGTCKIERGSRSDSYSCSIRFRFDSRKKGFCKRLARKLISELSAYPSYDDWLDCRYGTFMGRSLGGDDGQLVTVSLGAFLEWCDDRGLRPSESTLDAFALHSARGR